jgi:hypothetical protein
MEVLVLKAFMANGKPQPPGTVIDLPVADAAYAIGLKRAERIEASAVDADNADDSIVGAEFGFPEPKRVPPQPGVKRPRKANAE